MVVVVPGRPDDTEITGLQVSTDPAGMNPNPSVCHRRKKANSIKHRVTSKRSEGHTLMMFGSSCKLLRIRVFWMVAVSLSYNEASASQSTAQKHQMGKGLGSTDIGQQRLGLWKRGRK